MSRKFLLARPLLLGTVLLGGCADDTRYYMKPGASDQESHKDFFECQQLTQKSYIAGYGGVFSGGSQVDPEMLAHCMYGRGYTLVERDGINNYNARVVQFNALMAEKNRLDTQKTSLDSRWKVLSQEADRPESTTKMELLQREVTAHNAQIVDYQKRLEDYNRSSVQVK